jgi:sugar lactone lactonase YvrE
MKQLCVAAVVIGCAFTSAVGRDDPSTETSPRGIRAEVSWTSDPVFKVPESVLYDADRDVIYVSNINGSPMARDGNGFISKLGTDGAVENLEWAADLDAPKGMGILGDRLLVADISRLVQIDIASGEIAGTHDLDATFLNDIAIDGAGTVYISDNIDNKIYRFKDGTADVWLAENVVGPNGLLIRDGRLLVASIRTGNVQEISLDTKEIKAEVSFETGLDGLVSANGDAFLVSGFSGMVWHVSDQGHVTLLLDTRSEGNRAADIGFVPERKLLVVPTFDTRVIAYELSPEP